MINIPAVLSRLKNNKSFTGNFSFFYNIRKKFSLTIIVSMEILILILICSFSWYIGIKVKQNTINELLNEQALLIKHLHTLNKDIDFFSNLNDATLHEAAHKQELIRLYAEGDLNTLLKKLLSSLLAYRIDLLSYRNLPAERLKNDFYKCIIEFSLSGTYTDLGEYLFFLDELPILFQYKKIDITTKDNGLFIEINLTVELFYL
ncbi:MAG: hypothetical protein GY730_06230 [bacterium]|nr:hypothetical protein [bacterium]